MSTKTKTAKPKRVKSLRGGLDPTVKPASKAKANRTSDEQLAERLAGKVAVCCSGAWEDDVKVGHSDYPIPGMMLAQAYVLTTGDMVSNNHGTVGVRRWTPPLNVDDEDAVDLLGINETPHKTRFMAPATRYDGTRPDIRGMAYDPRKITVNDPPSRITRYVKLVDWPEGLSFSGRDGVRSSWPNVYRIRAADGGWLKDKGKYVLADGGGRHAGLDSVVDVPSETLTETVTQGQSDDN